MSEPSSDVQVTDETVPLPPLELRTGGAHFEDDDDYRRLAVRDVETLRRVAGLGPTSRVLDWGCGAGRLAVGLRLSEAAFGSYLGVDVQRRLVDWAQEKLGDGRTRFVLVDAPNARYNPDGRAAHRLPVDDASVDVLLAYSVLSHLVADDVAAYLRDLARALAPTGTAAVTAFVEEDVPAWAENPPGYGPLAWSGRLHCVRYDTAFLEDLVVAAGLEVRELVHGQETDGQSLIVLRRRGNDGHGRPDGGAPSRGDRPRDEGPAATAASATVAPPP